MTEFQPPLEWLLRFGSQLKEFYEFQCQEAKNVLAEAHKSPSRSVLRSTRKNAKQSVQLASVQKTTKKCRNDSISFDETPLKNKSPNILVAESLVSTPKRIAETPLRLQSLAVADSLIEVPPTEIRLRRTAAIKANKYVDIVARRLEQVPKNGSTPKIFKTANKLQTKSAVPSTPVVKPRSATLEASETPLKQPSSKKMKGIQYRVIDNEKEVDLNSPSSINIAPASVTRFRYHDALSNGPTIVPESATRSKTRTATLPNPDSTPLKQSTKSKPESLVIIEDAKQAAEEPVNFAHPATPKVTISVPQVEVEFVAPQSILRSSKRARKPVDFSSAYSEQSTPAAKKPNTSIPAIQALKLTAPTNTPLRPVAAEPVAPSAPRSISVTEQPNIPSIIVPGLTSKNSEASSSNEEVFPKRTPIRLKTPSRVKASLHSLADHNKIATLIEVQKSVTKESFLAAKATPKAAATPKVEPWTSRFLKESVKPTPAVPLLVKPVDTSKISGFSGSTSIPVANVPIVPKFPLNLANIASVTKSMNALEAAKAAESAKSFEPAKVSEPVKSIESIKPTEPMKPIESTKPVELVKTDSIKTEAAKMVKDPLPEESPLSRAKRIDMENKAREDKLKTLMADKAERLKKSMGEVRSPESEGENQKRSEPVKPPATMKPSMQSSKLPVKANVLPSPKVPSRLAEAFSGVDAELPSIDIGLVEDEKTVSKVLAGGSAIMTPKLPATPSQAQLHKTAILNSASRKMNPVDTTLIKSMVTPKIALPLASSSPVLPEIPSDDDEIDRQAKNGKENRPNWAMTPNLAVALNAQKTQRAEDIFGKVQPIKLEDFFKGAGKKYTNRSNL